MMRLLSGFAAFSLISGSLMTILPEGSVRRTASMAVGLLMLLYWADGLSDLLSGMELFLPETPTAVLTSTGVDLASAEAALESCGEVVP